MKDWEKEFDEKFKNWGHFEPFSFKKHIKDGKKYGGKEQIKDFIQSLLNQQKEEVYEKGKQAYMDVSTWKNYGEKYGFDKFFENKQKKEFRKEFKQWLEKGTEDIEDAIKRILN